MTSLLVPPASVRGMTCLDRSAFATIVEIPYISFKKSKLSNVVSLLKKYLLKIPNLKPIQHSDDVSTVYLDPKIITRFEDFTETDRNILIKHYERFGKENVRLSYSNFRTNEIFKAVLPENIEIPVSYSQVGHIVHLNLRDIHLPYKTLIGEVYLDNVPRAKTVVNKTNTIDTTFRYFTMEILAGEKDTVTTVKENNFTYSFDFAQVYWNSRLSTEHKNLVSLLNVNDVLYDVFAGVGPFAIPAAKRGVKVFANDLNPESYKWLMHNAELNNVKNNMSFFKMDGREFLKFALRDIIEHRGTKGEKRVEHIAMNLPSIAVEFLDVFSDCLTIEEMNAICISPPVVHLYCFIKCQKEDNPENLAKILVEKQLGCKLTSDCLIAIHNEIMGRKRALQPNTYNVFKVASTRKIRLKEKAKKVVTDLKKLDLKKKNVKGKEKIQVMNKEFDELRKEVLQEVKKKPVAEKTQTQSREKKAVARKAPVQTDAATSLIEQMQL